MKWNHALAMIAVMVVVCVAVSGMSESAASDTVDAQTNITNASGNCGTSTAKWEYVVETNTLSISGSGAVKPYSTGTGGWEVESVTMTDSNDTGLTDLDKIFIKSEITLIISGAVTIDASAFAKLSVGSVSFGTGFTSIGGGAFKDCKSLTEAALSNITSVGDEAFSGCTALATITFNTSTTSTTVTKIGANAFQGCTTLKSVNIGRSTIDATSFSGCTALATITATNSSTYKVEESLLYENNGKTMFLCPPGYKGTNGVISNVLDTVETINLGSESVTYMIDLQTLDSKAVDFVRKGTAKTSTGIAYSSLGMEKCSAAYSSGKFTITYTLYDGWDPGLGSLTVSPSAIPSKTAGKLEVSLAAGGSYTVLPMGVADMSVNQLKDVTDINGWTVDDVTCTVVGDRLTDILDYHGVITGYEGSGTATLNEHLVYNGVLFKVESISSGNGSYSDLTDLIVEGDPGLQPGTFANCTGLESVTMDSVTTLPQSLFRYCTSLSEVSLESCMTIGDYAFEGCRGLTTLNLGAEKITFGKGSFNNTGLDMIRVGGDSTVSGNPGVLVVHCDDDTEYMWVSGDNLIINGNGYASLSYSATKGGEGFTTYFYKGGVASVFIEGMDEVYLTIKTGTPKSQCLVVLDTVLGVDMEDLVVDSGTKLGTLPTPAMDGYTFKGWRDVFGSPVDANTIVNSSMVIKAEWQKDVSPDRTSTYVIAMFAVAVIGTAAVLFISTRR